MALSVAKERSTYVVTVSFDEGGSNLIPDTAEWTLTDAFGTVVNGRTGVEISSLAATVSIVLAGDDLSFLDYESDLPMATRRLLVEATYDGQAGNDMPLKMETEFLIQNSWGIKDAISDELALTPPELNIDFYYGEVPPLLITMPDDATGKTVTLTFYANSAATTPLLVWDSDDLSISGVEISVTSTMTLAPGLYWHEFVVNSVTEFVGTTTVTTEGQ